MRVQRQTIVAVVLLLLAGRGVSEAQWMSQIPRAEFGGYPRTFLDACLYMADWPTVRSVTNQLGSFTGDLWSGDNASLAQCFANMRNAGLTLTIEAAAFQPIPQGCGTGEQCYAISLEPILQKITPLNPPPIRIRMQEPLSVGRQGGWNNNDTVNQTVIFLQHLHANYPNIRVTSVEAYPYNSGPLLTWWMRALNAACIVAGVQPPDSFELDHDVNEHGWPWYWWEVGTIADQARNLGWTFGYIFGSPTVPGWSWGETARFQGSELRVYVVPDIFVFESWEVYDPYYTLPESYISSFMGTVFNFRQSGLFPR